MKVLFLDIDGVINSYDNIHTRLKQFRENKIPNRDQFGALFDKKCIKYLDLIIKETNCKIVISSSWRRVGLKKMKEMWITRELPGEIIDITPKRIRTEILAKFKGGITRGSEIQQWIEDNHPYSYCIVDDDDDMLPHQNFVKTNTYNGLDIKATKKIIKILNQKDEKNNFIGKASNSIMVR